MNTLIAALALWTAAPAGALNKTERLQFEEVSARFLDGHGLVPHTGTDWTIDGVLDHAYVQVDLGAYRIHFPRTHLDDRRWTRELENISLSLLDLQGLWIEWCAPPERGSFQAPESLRTLRGWVKNWSDAGLARVGDKHESPSLEALMSTPEDALEASAALRAQFADGRLFGLEAGALIEPVTLVLAPTRAEFLGLVCTVGELNPGARPYCWVENLPLYTFLRSNDLFMLALSYASPDWKKDGPLAGYDMNSREKTGVVQHVLQHAAEQLCRRVYGEALDPAFREALCIKAVIDVLDENNARSGGSGESNKTASVSKFVPGFTNGGILPPVNADSRWREHKGRYYFVRVLKAAQKEGRNIASKDRELRKTSPRIHFILDARDGKKAAGLVQAPFLGEVAEKSIPADCSSDYREFFRSYKTAFAHWLQHESGKKLKLDAEQSFAELLRRCAESKRKGEEFGDGRFEVLVEEVYDIPYSRRGLGDDCLEQAFLDWLPTGR